MKKDFSPLEKIIDLKFKNQDLLRQAFVHRSYINEHPNFELGHNERLEFLGDAVLELAVTEYLYEKYDNPEGDLTNWRASLVNSHRLAALANELGLEPFLFLSRGEAKDAKSKARQFILANAFEALVGAIYLDQGLKKARQFIKEKLLVKLDSIIADKSYLDPKSYFQESAQEKAGVTPHYQVLKESGPDHDKHFEVGIYLAKELVAKGVGTSKQEAQVDAATNAIKAKDW
ncbi:MAG: ribonuclease III [bacterium]